MTTETGASTSSPTQATGLNGYLRSSTAKKKAIVVVAHAMIVIIWHVMATESPTTNSAPTTSRASSAAAREGPGGRVMAGNTPARPWTAWPGDELRGGFHTAGDQAKTVHGVWLDGQGQAKDQMEAETP